MNLPRLFSRRELRSTGRPLPRRRPLIEDLEERQLLATFTVTNTNDSGLGSLRTAIIGSNSAMGATINTINFQIGSGGAQTIALRSALPTVTQAVTIDGTTQPGAGVAPRVVLDGTNASSGVSGLTVAASNSSVKGLAVDHFSEYGIEVSGVSGVTIADNYVGLTPTGGHAGNGDSGMALNNGADGNTVTGNVSAENGTNGIEILGGSDSNVVTGNLSGTNPSGTAAAPNGQNGVYIADSTRNVIGGTATGAGNVLSANTERGVDLNDNADGNLIEGNLIGTKAGGAASLGNGDSGILIQGASSNNVIGGTTSGARNVIATNGARGVHIYDHSDGNIIEGNVIGTAAGSTAAGNVDSGVLIEYDSNNNVVGGTVTGAGNNIMGNTFRGVHIYNASNNNLVAGNIISANGTGTGASANTYSGILIDDGSNDNTIGGTTAVAQNIITCNGYAGVHVYGSDGNVVEGNQIGAGSLASGNTVAGVLIDGGSANNDIGEAVTGAGNTIVNNPGGGVVLNGAGADNVIEGNVIETNGFGQPTAGLGDGISMTNTPLTSVIDNVIDSNRDWGIYSVNSSFFVITGNTFAGNGLGNINSD
jgi:parallel beta-helix repeat protein